MTPLPAGLFMICPKLDYAAQNSFRSALAALRMNRDDFIRNHTIDTEAFQSPLFTHAGMVILIPLIYLTGATNVNSSD